MSVKTCIILLLIFFIQLISSCCGDYGGNTYEISYESIDVVPYNTSGWINMEVEESVSKRTFGLEVSLLETVSLLSALKVSDFGFGSVLACSDNSQYIHSDPIVRIEVQATDLITGETFEVSDSFGVVYYENELVELNEIIQDMYAANFFELQLVDFDQISDSSMFIVKAHLESGKILSHESKVIIFTP